MPEIFIFEPLMTRKNQDERIKGDPSKNGDSHDENLEGLEVPNLIPKSKIESGKAV